MGLSNPIRDDLRRAGLLPDQLPDRDGVNSRGESVSPTVDRRTSRRELTPMPPETRDFLSREGWSVATVSEGGGRDGGLTSHRGVLHPDEHVDPVALAGAAATHLGFTLHEVASVYRQGPLSAEKRALRARIDARLLEVAEAGGRMVELGRALGMEIKPNGNCRILDNALRRARKARKERR